MMHEYCVNGHPREKVIFVLAMISIVSAPIISAFIHSTMQLYLNIIVTASLSGFTLFSLLYLLFNKVLWRINIFKFIFKFPDLNGEWECSGTSLNVDTREKTEWSGSVTINQTWDKILITLTTKNSTSHSISFTSGIKHIPGIGYKLSYHYENIPKTGEVELNKHEGSCTLTFCEDTSKANGSYFNNPKERKTLGEMVLTRRKK